MATEKLEKSANKIIPKTFKKKETAYQKYKNSKNKNGKKYFEFYDDIKVYTHDIYDW